MSTACVLHSRVSEVKDSFSFFLNLDVILFLSSLFFHKEESHVSGLGTSWNPEVLFLFP